MNDDELNQLAMAMLTNAGHAKKILADLLAHTEECAHASNNIEKELTEASDWLRKAHLKQNQVMQHADKLQYSLLLTHAQDTLMNTETIYFLVKRLLPLILNSKK